MAIPNCILTDFLNELGVPHTAQYTNGQFAAMPFQSLFGLSKLLEQYGIPSEGYQLSDKTQITLLTPPFLADTPKGFVIVTSLEGGQVSYLTQGEPETMPLTDFENVFNGVVFLAYPTPKSREPHYAEHRRTELLQQGVKYGSVLCAIALMVYMFITNGLYRHVSTYFIAAFDIAGLYFTFLLVQKTLKIKNKAADRVCGILQEGGCDSILDMKASKLFGVFSWSEVGFTYFSVSLLTLLIFPQYTGYLALCNACCLPYTVWSISYQYFKAHKWCTLCVSVQTTLWCLFFSYLFGGWFKDAFPLRIEFFVLALTYVTVMLALTRILPAMSRGTTTYNNEQEEDSADPATRA